MPRIILVVDDDVINREILCHLLSKEYTVLEAQNGKEALELLLRKRHAISAILLDLHMPVMDGFAFLRARREHPLVSHIPVIVLTGSTESETEKQTLALGATDFAAKPFDGDIILRRLSNLIHLHETSAVLNSLQKDKLTDVWNRETFFQKATDMIAHAPAEHYVLSNVDIENFKIVNDEYGVATGDAVLKSLCRALQSTCTQYSGMCGRIAADNFIILFPQVLVDTEHTGASRLEEHIFADTNVRVALHIGRYLVSDKTLSVSAMYDRAKMAKQSIKGRADRDIAWYDDAMRNESLQRQQITRDMYNALESGQFEIWLQPQYNHATKAMIGSEALVRWRHPERGLIPPYKFIPIFEQNGFIHALDKFVWEEACRCLRKWLDEGRAPLPISVNISRFDILCSDLIDVLTGLMKQYALPMNMLRLEITESAFTTNSSGLISVIQKLVDLGFTVEIDDFGSGYSSLNTLKDVPAQILKLDMKFMEASIDSNRGGSIVESIVRMAKWLGMAVLAEGVETTQQADYLESIGCVYIQGYLYAKPMPVADYENHCCGLNKEEHLIKLETVDNLDNNKLWNPDSIDSLIFNSYVGAACIFELYNGKLEIIRATKHFANFLDGISAEDVLKIDFVKYMDEESAQKLASGLLTFSASHKSFTDEFVFIDLPGYPGKLYLRSTLRVIAVSGNRSLIYCINENVTAQRKAEQDILASDEQARFLNDISHELLAQPATEVSINSVLSKLLEYFQGNRAYIFECNAERKVITNTYELCAEGVTKEAENLQDVPDSAIVPWLHAFEQSGFIYIEDISALDNNRVEERNVLEAQGISSLLAAPLNRDGKIIGILGIDDPRRGIAQAERLVVLGDYLAVMLTRRDLNLRIERDNKMLTDLMNDTPGGFARMRMYADGSGRTEYANVGFCNMLGMSFDEVLETYRYNLMAGVHANDLAELSAAITQALASNEVMEAKYRLRRKNGSYVWVQAFARFTRYESGDIIVNCYYADLSATNMKDELAMREAERREREASEQLSAIMQNMRSGVSAVTINNGQVNVIFSNNYYYKLLGYTKEQFDAEVKNAIDLVHPDDIARIREEINAVMTLRESRRYEYRCIKRDGSVVYLRCYANCTSLAGVGENVLLSLIIDISEIVLAQRGASQSTELMQSIMEKINSGISAVMVEGAKMTALFINKQYYNIFGYTQEQFETEVENLFDLFHPDDRPRVMSATLGVNAIGETGIIEGRIVRRDGEVRLIRVGISTHNLASVRSPVQISVVTDITQERSASDRLELLTNSVPGGLAEYVITPDTIALRYYNDGFCALFGSTRERFAQRGDLNILSWVFEEDRPALLVQIDGMRKNNELVDCAFRIHTTDHGYKWIKFTAQVSERNKDFVVANALLQDVTVERNSLETLRIREEENAIVLRHGEYFVCRYDIVNRTLTTSVDYAEKNNLPNRVTDVPYGPIRLGLISQQTTDAYIRFFEDINAGCKDGRVLFQHLFLDEWRWTEAKSTTIFSNDGKPVAAVISMFDVSERIEKEAIYKKWQQSLTDRTPSTFTLFVCNLSRRGDYVTKDGELLTFDFESVAGDTNAVASAYAEQCIHAEDRKNYLAVVNADMLLAGYYRNKRSTVLEYREALHGAEIRWLRLTIDLVESPHSSDVLAYLLYENIDEFKKAELETQARAERDPLTNLLNRNSFMAKITQTLSTARPEDRFALLMVDIDGFKRVNDVFGHGIGDQTLKDVANSICSLVRPEDPVARFGGDEFMLFLAGIRDEDAIKNKAMQICARTRKALSLEVQISSSVGIAFAPRNGKDFDTLYKKADEALYYVKGSGKNNIAVYADNMADQNLTPEKDAVYPVAGKTAEKKRRMLVVDDDAVQHKILQNIFKDNFIIESAKDGNSALIRLRNYGDAISVVLLDLMMPDMNGFAVLENMQKNEALRSIPVIIVSSDESRESCLKAVRAGAIDYITKPIDVDILSSRIQSAISKAENERLRKMNAQLEMQRQEKLEYEAYLKTPGIVFIGYDYHAQTFSSHPPISTCLLGTYDGRNLWQIFEDDLVANAQTIQRMQQLVCRVAEDGECPEATMQVHLKTPQNTDHTFRMTVRKATDEQGPACRLVISLIDLDYAVVPEAE